MGTVPLWLLIIGYLPSVPKVHYVAVCRATGHVARGAAVPSTAATIEVTAATLGGMAGGLDGFSYALVTVFIVEGAVTTPPVLRAAMGYGRHRHTGRAMAPTGQLASSVWRHTTSQSMSRLSNWYSEQLFGKASAAFTSWKEITLRILVDQSGYELLSMGDVAMLQSCVQRLTQQWPPHRIHRRHHQVLGLDPLTDTPPDADPQIPAASSREHTGCSTNARRGAIMGTNRRY